MKLADPGHILTSYNVFKFSKISYDTLRYAYKPSPSGAWSAEGVVNQYNATTSITPQGNYVNTGVGGGIFVVYRQYASDNIWYDRASHYNAVEEEIIGIAEEININTTQNNISFSFSLTKDIDAKIQIFDLSGREIATLFNGKLQTGDNSFSFDISNISSGNYIFFMTTPEKIISEKFSKFQ